MNMKTICMIGPTGVGKSSLSNKLGNISDDDRNAFKVAPTGGSVTAETAMKAMKWFDGDDVILIDTPGLNDSEGRDAHHIADMAKKLKEHKNVNLFILVFHGQVARIDEPMKDMLDIFCGMFTSAFLENACLVFTNWALDKSSAKRRVKSGLTEENRKSEFNAYLNRHFQTATELPCFFIDNAYDLDDDEDVDMYQPSLQGIKALCESLPAFECLDVKEVKKKAQLKLEAEQKKREEEVAAEKKKGEEEAKRLEDENQEASKQAALELKQEQDRAAQKLKEEKTKAQQNEQMLKSKMEAAKVKREEEKMVDEQKRREEKDRNRRAMREMEDKMHRMELNAQTPQQPQVIYVGGGGNDGGSCSSANPAPGPAPCHSQPQATSRCGAKTKKGLPCKNKVSGGGRCHHHQ